MEAKAEFKWGVEPGHSVEYLYQKGYPERFKDCEVYYFQTTDELKKFLSELEQDREGSIHVFMDFGIKPVRHWSERLFIGATYRDRVPCFTLDWCDDYAKLMFHDENSSEYHPLDDYYFPTDVPTKIRIELNPNEDGRPIAVEECMYKARAFQAAREFLDTGKRPEWLSYRYIR